MKSDDDLAVYSEVSARAEVAPVISEQPRAKTTCRRSEQFAQVALDSLSTEIAILDSKGNILWVNRAWLRFPSENASDDENRSEGANYLEACDMAIGQERADAYHVAEGIRAVIAGKWKLFTMDYPCEFPSGRHWFTVTVTPFPDPDDGRVVVAHEDVTVRKEAEIAGSQLFAALVRSGARLSEAQKIAKIGSYDYDLLTGEASWSDEMFGLLQLNRNDGSPSPQAFTDLWRPGEVETRIADLQATLLSGDPYEFDIRVLRQDGSLRWAHIVGQGERNQAGDVVRLYGALMDIHDRKMLEAEKDERTEQLIHATSALRTVLETAPIMLYMADAEGTMTLSEGAGLSALGLKPGEAVGRSISEFTTDSESREKTRRAFAGEAVSYEARVNGLWLQTELRPVLGEDGVPAGIIGVSLDVTDRIAYEQRFRVLFESSSDAHLLMDETGIVDCNLAAVAMLRCRDKSRLLALHPALFSPEFQPDGRRSHDKSIEMDALARANGSHRFEWTHRRLDGEEFPVEVTLTDVTIGDRSVLLVVWHDLTERIRAEQAVKEHAKLLEVKKIELERANLELEYGNARLEMLATTDGLTGLFNHRTFQERLTDEVCRAARHGTTLSLVLMDVDRFKEYNDTHGHPAGDAMLKGIARVVQGCARKSDVVARYGGEEFVFILPQTDLDSAVAYAERVRLAVRAMSDLDNSVTASFGVATLRLGELSGVDLVAQADKALYISKAQGRNRVTHAS